MPVVSMSKKEFDRLEVLLGVRSGRLRVADACELLNLKRRQVFRLLAGLKHGGAASLVSNSWARGLLRSGLSGTRLFVFVLSSCTSITPQPAEGRTPCAAGSRPAANAGAFLGWQTTDDSYGCDTVPRRWRFVSGIIITMDSHGLPQTMSLRFRGFALPAFYSIASGFVKKIVTWVTRAE